jgi:DNA-binding transcriptional LysR family regulator
MWVERCTEPCMLPMNSSDDVMQPLHLSKIDVNLLVGLDTLLRERSVTAAAKRLGLSQSAMSHQLRRLRELFEDPLLVGGRGGMVTSPLAETLEGPVRRALLDLGRAIRGELSFDPATAERTFTVATKDSVELLGLPPLLELLSREAPGIRVHGRLLGPSTFTALQEGDVDLVIGPDVELTLGVPFPGLRRRVLSREPSVCVVRAGHPVVERARREGGLTLERYLALRHVQVQPQGGLEASAVDEALAARELTRDVVARVTHFVSGLFIAAASDLAVTLARGIAEPLAATLSLALLEPPLSLPENVLVMTWHERCEEDPANKWLRSAVVRVSDRMHSIASCAGLGGLACGSSSSRGTT